MDHRFVQKVEIVIFNRQDKGGNLLLNIPDSTHDRKEWTLVNEGERKRMREVEDHPKFLLNLENIKARYLNYGKPLVAYRGKSHE